MCDYPLLINLCDRLCVVVGGGTVGQRKCRGLLEAGARVRLVDPRPLAASLKDRVEHRCRPYRPDDLRDALLVFAATDNAHLNRAVAAEARRRGALVNLPGDPSAGDFTLPAVLRRGDLTLTVSTGGGSPALARWLKQQLAEWLPEHWAAVVLILSAIRAKRLAAAEQLFIPGQEIDELIKGGLVELVATGQIGAVDQLLKNTLGANFSLAALAVDLTSGAR